MTGLPPFVPLQRRTTHDNLRSYYSYAALKERILVVSYDSCVCKFFFEWTRGFGLCQCKNGDDQEVFNWSFYRWLRARASVSSMDTGRSHTYIRGFLNSCSQAAYTFLNWSVWEGRLDNQPQHIILHIRSVQPFSRGQHTMCRGSWTKL